MAAPRKLPPDGAGEDIRRLAAEGYSQLGIAAHFKVSRECFKRWIEEDEALNEAYELGKETERQALHAMVVASARANKPANVNAFFLLKARHGYVETDNRTKVSVDVAINNVLVVRDHGSDEQWAAKCAAQQTRLIADNDSPHQIEASSTASQVEAVASFESPAYLPPVYVPQAVPVSVPVPVAPSWAAPVKQPAPYFGPPVFNWQAQPVPGPVYAPDPTPSAPAWRPTAPLSAPVWRGRA
jgi:hypothetical protein